MKFFHKKSIAEKLFDSIARILGIVLVWRGVWYMLDKLDVLLFKGSHFWTAVIGFILGLAILYMPDKDLKEIEKI